MAQEYDLVVLGAGIGGYVAAIRAAQEGLKTAIVEKEKTGGTCLHKGCIPSKALLRSAEVYVQMKDSEKFGIMTDQAAVDFEKVQDRKNTIVDKLYNGVQYLLKKEKIDMYTGHGRILGPSIFSPSGGTISVEKMDGSENDMLIPKNVLIATGSRPRLLPGLEPDGKQVLTSEDALSLNDLPASMVIIGGGVIGVEWASLLSDFDVNVTMIEAGSRILPQEDAEVSKEMTSQLKERGVTIFTDAEVLTDKTIKQHDVTVTVRAEGKEHSIKADQLLLAVGRTAVTEDIGLENTSISIENGFIATNEYFQTNESHMYAIGDVIGGLQLAHVASREGLIAVEHMLGNDPLPLDEKMIPKCTYSRPEIASIGLTEVEAAEQGHEVKTGIFPLEANGKALIHGEKSGFMKIVANKGNDDLLGVHMIGTNATELISEAALAKLVDASVFEISETIHPHPAIAEIFGEAALAADGKAIHS
ncbi:dihydrolipoyl dehydrogenase [Bacillus piscicola]|uniref:dihydrolipoyl dehydrogenase n=1 Tax=Bacillus piscicola TaxID=1632684 RepID=UPI001F08E968|nr:dihydrolipoyl dehydrogenase [Bacillus piscicola]